MVVLGGTAKHGLAVGSSVPACARSTSHPAAAHTPHQLSGIPRLGSGDGGMEGGRDGGREAGREGWRDAAWLARTERHTQYRPPRSEHPGSPGSAEVTFGGRLRPVLAESQQEKHHRSDEKQECRPGRAARATRSHGGTRSASALRPAAPHWARRAPAAPGGAGNAGDEGDAGDARDAGISFHLTFCGGLPTVIST